jgi:hypothetical protein
LHVKMLGQTAAAAFDLGQPGYSSASASLRQVKMDAAPAA